jgi:hypothetical protein
MSDACYLTTEEVSQKIRTMCQVRGGWARLGAERIDCKSVTPNWQIA